MSISYDLVVAAVIGTVILFLLYQIRGKNTEEPFNILSAILESYLSGLTIYMGLAAIWLAFSSTLPFGLETIANNNVISFFGGLFILFGTIAYIFKREISSKAKQLFLEDNTGNLKLSIKTVNDYFHYKTYKIKTEDPELDVVALFKDGTIQVKSNGVNVFLHKDLIFSLKIKQSQSVGGKRTVLPSRDVALCKLKSLGNISTFTIIKWINIKEYKTEINNLKKNKNIKKLKPFIVLRSNYLADKCCVDDLTKAKEGIDKLMQIKGGE